MSVGAQKAKILVVEDNDLTRRLLHDLLRTQGFDVVLAENGLEGLNAAKREKPALILMDIQMPVMSGIEAARKIREDASIKSTPILAVTAFVDQHRDDIKDLGVFDKTIGKPFSVLAIMDVVRSYLR